MGIEKIFLTANWRHLVMLNYEIDPSLLSPFVPYGTELDRWNEQTFISLVGFQFLRTRLFGFMPIPIHSNFDEVNLRFYVRRQVGDEVRRGVVFIQEIVPRRAVAFVARSFYNENYIARPMAHVIRSVGDDARHIAYKWRNDNRWSEINLQTTGASELPAEGSVEKFITEHYWGYAAQPDRSCVEYRVTHPQWKVWHARHSAFEGDVEELYGKDIADVVGGKPSSAFLAEGSRVTVMRGCRVS